MGAASADIVRARTRTDKWYAHLSGRTRSLTLRRCSSGRQPDVSSVSASSSASVERNPHSLIGLPLFLWIFLCPQSFISLSIPSSVHNRLDFGNWTTDSEWNSIIRIPKEILHGKMISFFILLYNNLSYKLRHLYEEIFENNFVFLILLFLIFM